MNAEQLLKHYERIAEAQDAVGRLRRLVIDLAVRGKLVPQLETDTPATPSTEEAARTSTGRKTLAPTDIAVGFQEQPFEIPRRWIFVRLGSVLQMINGRAFKPSDWKPRGIPIVRIQNLNNPAATFNYCDIGAVDERHLIRDGEFLISWSGTPGTSFGAFIWSRGLAALNQHIFRCIQNGNAFTPQFLRLAINSQLDVLISQAQGGVGLQHVTKGTLEALPLPVPPVAEQHRIVAKVDELMALCDRLEAARAQREATRDRLAAATLARLNTPAPHTAPDGDASNGSSFQTDARFAINALPALTTRPDQIKQLRQTILNLAVRGKLVAQSSGDGSGQQTLLSIRTASTLGESDGRASTKRDDFVPIREDEIYLDIPSSWTWARVKDLGRTQTGTSPSSGNEDLFGNFIPFIKPSDLDGPEINYLGPGLSEIGVAHSRLAPLGSVLMVCIGATLGKVNTTSRAVCFNQQINSVSPFLNGMTKYLALALKASGFQSLAWSKAGTGTLPIISKGKWEVLPVPVPPLTEQHRIVAKIEELMTLCDQLEASLTRSETTRSRLLEALLHEALAPVNKLEEAA